MLTAATIASVLFASTLVVPSPEHPDVTVEIDTDELCVWVPETARDCPPELRQRFAPLAAELEAEFVAAPMFVAFVRERGEGGQLALVVSTRAPEPHIAGDDQRFGPAQGELLCEPSCTYSIDEFNGVAIVRVPESMPNQGFARHTVFRGEQATVYATVREWSDDLPALAENKAGNRWEAELNAAISVSPAPLEPAPPTREPWLPVILRILIGLSAAGIGMGLLIARVRARR